MALSSSVRGRIRSRPWFFICALLAICAHAFLVWSAAAQEPTILRSLYYDSAFGMGRAADFNAVYHAAVNIDKGLSPYGKAPDGITPYFQAFRYLPIVAVGAQAFLRFTPLHAYWVWVAVLEVLLAWLILALRAQIRAPVVWGLASLCLLISSPYLLEIYMGQFTFAATALTALAVSSSLGPVMYTVAALLKVFPLAIVPALVQRRKYWAHAALSTLCVIFLSAQYFLHHPGTWSVFWRRNFLIGPGFGDGNYGLVQLLRLVVEDIGPDLSIWRFDQATSAARIAALILVSMLVILSRRRDLILGICALLLAHFVTYHQVWEHHLSAVLVVASLLLVTLNGRPGLTAVTLFCMLLLVLPTPFAQLNANWNPAALSPILNLPRFASYLLVAQKAVPTLALFLLCAFALFEGGLDSPRNALSRMAALLAAGRQRDAQRLAGGTAA